MSGTVEELLVAVAVEVGASVSRSSGCEFRHGSTPFAFADANTAELRLDPEIAVAALGTPGTATSSRGGDWVRLTADPGNPHDLDRARAWFLSAWRNAGG